LPINGQEPVFAGSCFISSRSVSRVLYPGSPTWGASGSSIIYLLDLPPGIGRATLISRYTWSFSPEGGRLSVSPPEPVSSYLTFSPLHPPGKPGWSGYFLPRCLCPREHLPPGSLVLCTARTFLSSIHLSVDRGTIERPAGLLQNYRFFTKQAAGLELSRR